MTLDRVGLELSLPSSTTDAQTRADESAHWRFLWSLSSVTELSPHEIVWVDSWRGGGKLGVHGTVYNGTHSSATRVLVVWDTALFEAQKRLTGDCIAFSTITSLRFDAKGCSGDKLPVLRVTYMLRITATHVVRGGRVSVLGGRLGGTLGHAMT
ncbi:hypothetical protein BDR03DRAFT_1019691 [Suillus americanus]|nr:hypothetical protein BDR03DRAFT_1019691 [Suillus americanus]